MNTQKLKNGLMRVLYNTIVALGKGLVWTIRFVTGQDTRDASLQRQYDQYDLYAFALREAERGDLDMVRSLIGHGSPASLMPGIDTTDLTARYYALREVYLADRQAKAVAARNAAIDGMTNEGRLVRVAIDAANDTKPTVTVINGGAK